MDDAWGGLLNTDLDGIDNIVHGIDARPPYVLPTASTTILGGVKADGTTIHAAVDGTISTFPVAPGTNPNRLDNGDMWVDQHNAGASVAVGAGVGVWCTDRWAFTSSKAKFTIGQNYSVATKAPGFQYFFGVQTTGGGAAPAAADLNGWQQGIEFDAFSDFGWGTANAQPATVSFWVNSSLTGNFSFCLSGNVTPYRVFITTYNIPTANTWTKIVIPIPADTTVSATNWTVAGNAPGLYILFDLGSGATTQTSTSLGAWQNSATVYVASGAVKLVATSNAKWAVTGVKLEAGSAATPYPVEDLARKRARCQRYFQHLGDNGVFYLAGYAPLGGASLGVPFSLPVTMRAAPTVTVIGPWQATNVASFNIYPGPDSLSFSITPTASAAYVMKGSSGPGDYLAVSAEI